MSFQEAEFGTCRLWSIEAPLSNSEFDKFLHQFFSNFPGLPDLGKFAQPMFMLVSRVARLHRQCFCRRQIHVPKNFDDVVDFFKRGEKQSLPLVFDQIDRPFATGCPARHWRLVVLGLTPDVGAKGTMNPERHRRNNAFRPVFQPNFHIPPYGRIFCRHALPG